MLADPNEERAWPNIVMVLGMLGDERAVSPLISLIEQNPKGELDYFQYDAKRNAIFGLGYLVNKSGNQRALAYLKDGLDPSAWTKRGITWASPEHETATERNRELSRVAIIGLGLSGDPSAAEALRALLTAAPTAVGPGFRQQMSGVIWEALRANQRIAAEGLAGYYREPAP
jgi:HEAT repeat protein